jgi:hypothetical protein
MPSRGLPDRRATQANHYFHLVPRPLVASDLGRWMQWLLMAHARHYGTSGHVWQGRFQAFPIRDDLKFVMSPGMYS